MMLPMMPEMITREQRTEEGETMVLGARFVAISALRFALRQVRSEIEELQRTEQRWSHPEEEQVGNGNLQKMVHEIERERHAQKLLPCHVSVHEMKIPASQARMLAVVRAGIFATAGLRVMFAMLGFEPLK